MTAELELRAPEPTDAAAIADVLNEHSRALFGESDLSEQEIRHWFSLPNIWIRVVVRDGRLVGYVDVTAEEDGTHFHIDARTLDPGAAALAVATGQERALELAPDGAIVRGYVSSQDEVVGGAYRTAGFVPIRHSFNMRIELTEPPEPPVWPEGIDVRTYDARDEQRVYEAHMESFEDHWDFRRSSLEEWRAYGPARDTFDPELNFVAWDGDEIAGVALCSWHHSGDPRFGWIGVLAVRRPWRGRGLGCALLLHSFREFARRGGTRVGLGVDAENPTGAVRLYERAGMHVVRRADTYEKTL